MLESTLTAIGGALAVAAVMPLGRWLVRSGILNSHRQVLGTRRRKNLTIVIPQQSEPPHPGGSVRRLVVYEEVLALSYVQRLADLAGLGDGAATVVSDYEFARHGLEGNPYFATDIVLVGSPIRNQVGSAFQGAYNNARPLAALQWQAIPDAGPGHWEFLLAGLPFRSPEYPSEPGPGVPDDPAQTARDIALIMRVDSPWAEDRKVLMIAGIRGIGTWGGARYLRDHARDVLLLGGGRDFAAVIDVTYSQSQAKPKRTVRRFQKISDGGSQWPWPLAGVAYRALAGLGLAKRLTRSAPIGVAVD